MRVGCVWIYVRKAIHRWFAKPQPWGETRLGSGICCEQWEFLEQGKGGVTPHGGGGATRTGWKPMNEVPPSPPLDFSVRRTLDDLKEFARREPAQAVAAAIGVGLLINLLPSRMVTGTVAIVGAALVRPVLLSLGVTKAMELCCQKSPQQIQP